jgi:hypothetical protein
MKKLVTPQLSHFRRRLCPGALFLLGVALVFGTTRIATAQSEFNHRGNILVTDQFNNRVIEIDPAGNIVWHFGNGPTDFTANSIVGTNDAERVGRLTLMAGTGIPPGVDSPPAPSSGVADNRVLLVNEAGQIVWQYGEFGVTGSGFDQLNTPVQNTFLPNGHVLITDQSNERVIEVRHDKTIAWQYGQTGVTGIAPGQLNNPNSAELLENGHVLIADENNNRAIEVTHRTPSKIVATFSGTISGLGLSGVAFASRLPNGHTLITDSNNSRIVETDETGADFWHYFTNTSPGSNPSPLPTRAVRLSNGNTLISDQFNDRVIEVSKSGNIVASYGNINQIGFGTQNASQGLNGPYSAYVIGVYIGITPPFADDGE